MANLVKTGTSKVRAAELAALDLNAPIKMELGESPRGQPACVARDIELFESILGGPAPSARR